MNQKENKRGKKFSNEPSAPRGSKENNERLIANRAPLMKLDGLLSASLFKDFHNELALALLFDDLDESGSSLLAEWQMKKGDTRTREPIVKLLAYANTKS